MASQSIYDINQLAQEFGYDTTDFVLLKPRINNLLYGIALQLAKELGYGTTDLILDFDYLESLINTYSENIKMRNDLIHRYFVIREFAEDTSDVPGIAGTDCGLWEDEIMRIFYGIPIENRDEMLWVVEF